MGITIGQRIARILQRLPEGQRMRVLRQLSPPLSDKAMGWIIDGGWSAEIKNELEARREAILEALLRVADLDDDELWLLDGLEPGPVWRVPPRAAVVRMRLPTLQAEAPPGVRVTDLAVTSVCLAQLHERYRLGLTAVSPAVPEPEPFVSVGSGSVQFTLSASGFGTGVLLVALAFSGAALPIAAPAWVIAAGGVAIAAPSAAQLVADVRKSWFEGSKARDEAAKAREDAAKTRQDREHAASEAEERKRQPRPGLAELFGIPDAQVRSLAARFDVRPAVAYHLINRVGPGMVDTMNAGIEIEVTEVTSPARTINA